MGTWSDITSINGQSDPAQELMQFRIELNRRLRHAFANISAQQIVSGLNDLSGILTMAKGGTGAALSVPASDRILFYDVSENKFSWLSVGNSVAISTTTLDTTQDLRTSASPTFAGATIGTLTGMLKASSGVVSAASSSSDYQAHLGYEPANKAGDTMSGDLEFASSKGVVLKSPDNTKYRITVDNSGVLGTTAI